MFLHLSLECLPYCYWNPFFWLLQGSTDVELPFSAWAFMSTIFFGIILIFYIDSIAEEKYSTIYFSYFYFLHFCYRTHLRYFTYFLLYCLVCEKHFSVSFFLEKPYFSNSRGVTIACWMAHNLWPFIVVDCIWCSLLQGICWLLWDVSFLWRLCIKWTFHYRAFWFAVSFWALVRNHLSSLTTSYQTYLHEAHRQTLGIVSDLFLLCGVGNIFGK